MAAYTWINDQELTIESWNEPVFDNANIMVDVLRLDLLHPVVSGNKWLKLKGWLPLLKASGAAGICTQGGPWSNHLVAVAAACQALGYKSAGLLKDHAHQTETLLQCGDLGMTLHRLPAHQYNDEHFCTVFAQTQHLIYIPMGGSGEPGTTGFAELVRRPLFDAYNHIICAVGSGTMISGVYLGKRSNQFVTGISALRLQPATIKNIEMLIGRPLPEDLQITGRFAGKGYAKADAALINWMNNMYETTGIPTDIVYTAKTCMATATLANENYFQTGEKILVIHSGGLQGNRSLLPNTLKY